MWHEYPTSVLLGGEPTIPTIVDRRISEVDENGDGSMETEIQTTTHSFTHIDAPRHWGKDGTPLDEIDPNKLVGQATVFDLTHMEAGDTVTAEDLEATGQDVQEGEIAILRTDWSDEKFGTEEYWKDMIGLSWDAGNWLLEKGVKGIAVDFYHDPAPVVVDDSGEMSFPEHRNHQNLLYENEILFFEHCTNFGAIGQSRAKFIGAPMKIKGADGGPLRVLVET
jgi:kynurenine formamidase